eukprot:CAMPEP_0197583806 /NCGR_PEP_ID=MMETSP1326-20131121/6601_1 /TAXON_ID=1155430 /ORGANISM="Genus nov. species nov., Strain RCC2288" /LENGTH=362 /DNA_ID=CAMNT_0043148079 /DNA_START=48 /DNA_END=1136 /DNA_ORIENTATION=+
MADADEMQRGADHGGEHAEPAETSEGGGGNMAQFAQQSRIPSQKYKVTKQDVRDAIELILQFSKNNPTSVVAEVAELLCMKFKDAYPNVQLLLRRTIQKCKTDAAEDAHAKAKAQRSPGEDGVKEGFMINDIHDGSGGASGGSGGGGSSNKAARRTAPDRASAEKAEKADKRVARMRAAAADKEGNGSGIGDLYKGSPTKRKPAGGSTRAQDKENSMSQVPELPQLVPSGNKQSAVERVTSGRKHTESHRTAKEQGMPDAHVRQWMLDKHQKEKEREKIKRRALDREMKWIEDMAKKQQERNKQNKKLEERNEAATQIQNLYRGHAARKVMTVLREERKRQALLNPFNKPTMEQDSQRLFAE